MTDSNSTPEATTEAQKTRIPASRVWRAGAIAIVASVAANVILALLLAPLFNISPEFPPFQIPPVAILTAIMGLLATVTYWIITRVSSNPVRTFWIVAVIALILSISPDIALAMDPSSFPEPGATTGAFLLLITFHVVAAVIDVLILTRMS